MSHQKFASRAVSAVFAGALTMGLAMAAHAGDAKQPMEKCYGVAKAGKNDCAGPAHACAGQSKETSSKEWIKLPKGSCERIVGGSLSAK